jgi:ABC-type transport system substrate-binding protein
MKNSCLCLIFVASLLILTQIPISATSFSTEVVNPPQVDKIMFKILTGSSQQVAALQDRTIQMIGNAIDPSYESTLASDANIEISTVLQNRYPWMMINCQRYPLNITAFRRALAFAVDKVEISGNAPGGLATPLDSVVPAGNPLSIEHNLQTTYYSKSVSMGQQILADAGFANIDADSYLEAPDGTDFSVRVETGSNSGIAPVIGTAFMQALEDLNINVTLDTAYHSDYLSRITVYRDYDIALMGRNYDTVANGLLDNLDVRWLADEFCSNNSDSSTFNTPGFENETYDMCATQLIQAHTYSEMNLAATKLQEILWYECPVVVCCQYQALYAHRDDQFVGYVDDPLNGPPNWWTALKIHPVSGTGGTFDWSLSEDVNAFNPLVLLSDSGERVNGMLWDTLLAHGADQYYVPNLASSCTVQTHSDDVGIAVGHMKITFNLVHGTGCSDSSELTSADVNYSINFYKEAPSPYTVGLYSDPNSHYDPGLNDLVSTSTPSPYTFVCEFSTESFWHLLSVGLKPILNKEYMESSGISPLRYDLWNPDPLTEEIPTTGPFFVSAYGKGEFIEISRNPYYVRSESTTTSTTSTTTSNASTTSNQTSSGFGDILAQYGLYIGVGVAVVLIVAVFIVRRPGDPKR